MIHRRVTARGNSYLCVFVPTRFWKASTSNFERAFGTMSHVVCDADPCLSAEIGRTRSSGKLSSSVSSKSPCSILRLGRFGQQRLHVGQHEAHVERAGTVDVADVAGAVYQEHAQGVIERAGRVVRVLFPVNGLAVSAE